MRLNLGCGADYLDGFVNIDIRDDVRVDRLLFADALPAEFRGACEEIWARSVFEHFPPMRSVEVLEYWRECLCPGGRLYLEVPDMLVLSRMLVERPDDDRGVIRNMLGGHRFGPEGSYDCHHVGWTPVMFERLLSSCGYERVRRLDPGDCNMAYEAFRPVSSS